jgi:hypothetical protein
MDALAWFGLGLLLAFALYIFAYIVLNMSTITIFFAKKRYTLKIAMFLVLVSFFLLQMFAYQISYRFKLAIFFPKCKAIIAEIEEGKFRLGGEYEKKGLRFKIEKDLPLKVVFVFNSGIIDNWVGLVYDPSRFVERTKELKPNFSNWNDKEYETVKKLFGGDMFNCNLIEESWYICSFT